MSKTRLFVVSVVLMLSIIRPIHATDLSKTAILEQINYQRLQTTAPSLSLHDELSRTAQHKCDEMIELQYYAHTSVTGETFKMLMDKSDYDYRQAAENVTFNHATAESAVISWLNSPPHKKEMLNPIYEDIGVGISSGEFKGLSNITIICTHFGASNTESSVLAAKTTDNETPAAYIDKVLQSLKQISVLINN